MKYVASIEVELTQEEVEDLTALSKEWDKSFAQTARECMNTHCKEMLYMFKTNLPEENIISEELEKRSTNLFEGLSGGVTIDDEEDCLSCQ